MSVPYSTWQQWKAGCKISACNDQQIQELHSIILPGLTQALGSFVSGKSNADLASLFDQYTKFGIEAVAKKDWLFRKFDHLSDLEERARGLSNYIFTVCKNPNSIPQDIRKGEFGKEQLLPEDFDIEQAKALVWQKPESLPNEMVSRLDEDDWASQLAAKWSPGFFAALSRQEKALIYAGQHDLGIDDEEVAKLAGRKLATLYAVRKNLKKTLLKKLSRTLPTEEPEVLEYLLGKLLVAMIKTAEEWKSLEKA